MPEETLVPRVPPHSEEAEQSVIGSVLLDEDAANYATENLRASDFYNPKNKEIFEAILDLHAAAKFIDAVTVNAQLEKRGTLEAAGGTQYLARVAVAVPSSIHIKDYVKTVRERALYRRYIKLGGYMQTEAYSGQTSIEEMSEKVETEVFNILQNRGNEDFSHIRDLLGNVFDTIETVSQNGGVVAGISTGYVDLDAKLAGLHPSELVLLGARPSMGKSALALNIVQNAAMDSGKVCAVFSLEMSSESMANRMLASGARVDLEHMRSGNMDDNDWARIVDTIGPLSEAPIFFDDTPSITISEMRSKCRKLKIEHGLDLIMIDYLQLMNGSGRGGENRQQEISEISRGLKMLARELQVPVLALSQLSRGVEGRNDKRPMMSDLRESGAIEQDADVVMFIYRDEYYNEDSEERGVAEIIIGKQRNGPTGTVKLRFDGQYTKFSNLLNTGY